MLPIPLAAPPIARWPQILTLEPYQTLEFAQIAKVAAVGLACLLFFGAQMCCSLTVTAGVAATCSLITLLSETFLRRHNPQNINWLNFDFEKSELMIHLAIRLIALPLIAALMTACGILPLQAVAIEIMKGDADLILLVTLIAPLAEEILFRGFIQERLEDIASMASHYLYPLSNAATMQIAAVAQSLLFGAIHIIGNQVGQRSMAIVVFGATSLLGLILAQSKNEHASLLPAIAIHSSQNTGFTLGLLGGQALRRAVIA
ncbi:MAG: CPBP family intramembrane glutamic endopeptidase [Chlamydiales bacterium]